MNDNYQKFIDSNDNDKIKKSAKFYFDLLDKNDIDLSGDTITTIEQMEYVFVKCNLNSFNSVINMRSMLKTYSIFVNDIKLFDLIRKVDIYRILDKIMPNMKQSYISQSDFEDVYNSIGAYGENTFSYNTLFYQSLFWCVYAGIYSDDMTAVKNLRGYDIVGNIVTLRTDSGDEWQIDIPEQLATDLITLSNEFVWYRQNRQVVCEAKTEGLFYDSVFKVELRTANSKYAFVSSYYTRLRMIAKEYLGHTLSPKNLFMSGIINRIKEQYGKSDELFVEGIKISDPVLVDIFNKEAKRCHYEVGFWNFRQTILGRI